MSNPGEEAPQTLIEQDGALPETVEQPVEKAPETPVEAPEGEEKPAAEAKVEGEQPKTKRTPWYQERINEITAARREEERKRIAAEDRLKVLEAAQSAASEDMPSNGPQMTQEAFQEAVRAEAQRLAMVEKARSATDSMLSLGNKEFGKDEFAEKCNLVADIGLGDSPDFMKAITDPEIIPDGHKLIAALADNPEEAQRIAKMKGDPTKLTAALIRFQASAAPKAPETPVSKAPAPIKPIDGSAKPAAPSDSDDIKTWMAKRNATAPRTAGGYPNRH